MRIPFTRYIVRIPYWVPILIAALMVERYFDLFVELLMQELVITALENGWYDWRMDVLEFIDAQLNPDGLVWVTILLVFSILGLGGAIARRRRF